MTGQRVLVVNAGSSSLKHQLREGDEVLARGTVERIGAGGPPDHAAAFRQVLDGLRGGRCGADGTGGGGGGGGDQLEGLVGVGHRVVHGGTRYTAATVVDDAVEAGVDALSALAPLHNPPQLAGIRALRDQLPGVPQVAVFDTAFHATIPARAHTYAIDAELAARHGLRKYGFHGTSVQVVTRRAAEHLGVPLGEVDLVVAHVGNGVSVTAVRGGRSADTTMGLTPLAGVAMGTRSGDVDPSLSAALGRLEGMDAAAVDAVLNHRSGLAGLCGDSDVRTVTERADGGDAAAAAALEVYCYRLSAAVGSFLALLGPVHAVVFTAGVGENSPRVRAAVCAPLAHLGVVVDAEANAAARGPAGAVAVDGRPGAGPSAGGPRVLVVPTDEEGEIAAQVLAAVR